MLPPQGPIDRVLRGACYSVPRTRSIGPCGDDSVISFGSYNTFYNVRQVENHIKIEQCKNHDKTMIQWPSYHRFIMIFARIKPAILLLPTVLRSQVPAYRARGT